MNVCHVVVVVSDNLTNAPTDLHYLLDRAICLKPTVFTKSSFPQSNHKLPNSISEKSDLASRLIAKSFSEVSINAGKSKQGLNNPNSNRFVDHLDEEVIDTNEPIETFLDHPTIQNQVNDTEKKSTYFETESKDVLDALDRLKS